MKNIIVLCVIFPTLLSCKFKYEEKQLPKNENQITSWRESQANSGKDA